ncbi:MAG TPA: Crp/Fnr family transcriptional regulator [Gemmatimonadaceae bacterium]|nr:Crp/Fnr family transcriptional regulator [Gemmatimonadaceae bacterium]
MLDPALLDTHPLLRDAAPAARRELAARGVERRYAAGETIFAAGSPSRGLFVVVEGRVRVTRLGAGGRGRVVHVEGPGGTLGEVPLFDGGGYPATAVAAAPTRCLVFGRDALGAAIAAEPALAWALLRRLASRVRHLVDRLDDLTAQRTTARLAAHLLERAAAARGRDFTLGGTQAEVAEELGTVREVVVRGLRALRAAGAIRPVARGRFALGDERELRRRAGRE